MDYLVALIFNTLCLLHPVNLLAFKSFDYHVKLAKVNDDEIRLFLAAHKVFPFDFYAIKVEEINAQIASSTEELSYLRSLRTTRSLQIDRFILIAFLLLPTVIYVVGAVGSAVATRRILLFGFACLNSGMMIMALKTGRSLMFSRSPV